MVFESGDDEIPASSLLSEKKTWRVRPATEEPRIEWAEFHHEPDRSVETLKRMALLFSHALTEEQKQEAREKWGIGTFLSLPDDLQSRWSQVPPEGAFPREWIQPVIEWLSRETGPGDVVLVQGEFGAVYLVVSWCHREGRIPV